MADASTIRDPELVYLELKLRKAQILPEHNEAQSWSTGHKDVLESWVYMAIICRTLKSGGVASLPES